MKARLALALLALGTLLVQAIATTLLPQAIRPDLVLVVALALGLRRGSSFALLAAFALGFAVDALSGSPLGLFALLRGTACAITRALDGALYLRASGPWASYTAVVTVVDVFAMGLLLHSFAPDAAPSAGLLALVALGTALPTALLAPLVLALFRRIDGEAGREAGLGLAAPGTRS